MSYIVDKNLDLHACGICHKVYARPKEAYDCEFSHMHIEKIPPF